MTLLSEPDFESRVRTCCDYVTRNNISIDRLDFEAAASAFFYKLLMADQYEQTDDVPNIRNIPVTLIRCDEGQGHGTSDYGLSEVNL